MLKNFFLWTLLFCLCCFFTLDCDGSDVGTEIWPADAISLHATSSSGFVPQPPEGSDCSAGAAEYELNIASGKLEWTLCIVDDWETPWLQSSGSRILTTAELETIDEVMNGLSIYEGDMCGADKGMLTVQVATPEGISTYHDNFYSCHGDDKVYVENIDSVFSALRKLVTLPS